MRIVQIQDNGRGDKGSAELNQHVEDAKKEVRDGIAGEGQGLLEEDESRIIVDTQGVNDRRVDLVQAQIDVQRPQEQSQGQAVHWERFLPVRSLKVLLVENDDSTRHVVSALLRNCSYEVTAVSNGLEAWRILKDSDNQIDLILTEVVMPGLSGIGLLSMIMSHMTCKNIPVIMMSSHDSMGIVFKCLSKGAVDFLVKPIRKNELKNLWQHVWRKCHSSSGSGSEIGNQSQKNMKSNSVEESEKDTGCNNDDDTRSIGLLERDGSDNESGTQSSWTKKAVEVESPQPMSPWNQFDDPPDSTCAQVIHSKPEAFASSWVPIPAKEHLEPETQLDRCTEKSRFTIEEPRKQILPGAATTDDHFPLIGKGDKLSDKGMPVLGSEKLKGKWMQRSADLVGIIASHVDAQRGSLGTEIPSSVSEISKLKVAENVKELPSLELSLKRLGDISDIRTSAQEQNVLRHSELSAFTRYNTGSTANQAQTANVGSCSPPDNCSEAAKTESMRNLQSNFYETPPNQLSNNSSNNDDMGSTTNKSFCNPQAMQNAHETTSQPTMPDAPVNTVSADEGAACPTWTQIEVNAANRSVNGSGSGSNHGSNMQNGSCTAVNAEGNMVSDNGASGQGVAGHASGCGSRIGADKNWSAYREAALNKFLQKRKERCFEKRVRYQSRKKLAEQRPRVRGQFVRQVRENKSKDAVS
ncbi:hypothetical protein Nepgr_009756 [Nepenthes gracilis]|uniref:Uncharacterized protein n=1 Tax=Nepenthes gracilis TaxID=150966 RepID=A0AAD3SBR0_NEPGR|nr:hypothetical protein Nepgr_009756 [Nepenthes gracilis]